MSTSSASPVDRADARRHRRLTGTTAGTAGARCRRALRHPARARPSLVVLLAAARRRGRARSGPGWRGVGPGAAARDDADRVEAEWQSLLLRLQDIGFVPPDGATPRQASRQIGHAAYLTPDENDALGRVVATVELARYARPGPTCSTSATTPTVWRGALSRRRRAWTGRGRCCCLLKAGAVAQRPARHDAHPLRAWPTPTPTTTTLGLLVVTAVAETGRVGESARDRTSRRHRDAEKFGNPAGLALPVRRPRPRCRPGTPLVMTS